MQDRGRTRPKKSKIATYTLFMNSLGGGFTRVGLDLKDSGQTSKVIPHSGSGMAAQSRNTLRSGKDRESEKEIKDRTRSTARIERGRRQG